MENTTISKREQNKIECRESILKASRRLFSSNGYDETKMEDIAQVADVSKATLYNYFPNKESLLIGTVQSVIDEVQDCFRSETEKNTPPREKLAQVFEILIISSFKYPSLTRRISFLNSYKGSELFGCFDALIDVLRQIIAEMDDAGDLVPGTIQEQVVDFLRGIYYVSLYEWAVNIDYTDSFDPILQRTKQSFDAIMAPFLN